MNLGKKIALSITAFAVMTVTVSVFAFIGTKNSCVRHEKSLKAQLSQNKNSYSNYFNKLKEVAKVPEMYTEDLKSVYNEAIESRYGSTGSSAVIQFIHEHNPNFNASLYKSIQQTIEAGRNDFESNQKLLIDKKRVYEVFLGEFPSGFIASVLGYPTVDLDDFKIVTNDETEEAFKSGKAKPIQLR